jgi:excisionase family DNA binding protein
MEDGGKRTVFWDAKDVAARLKCSRQTVYRKKDSGELPHIKVFGTLVRFDPDVVMAIARGKGIR